MKNQALIRINGKYITELGTDSFELTTLGTFTCVDGKYYITYREQESDMGNVVTTLTADSRGRVTLSRTGDITSRLILETGKRHTCHYSMTEGQLLMGVFSDSVVSELDDNGGRIFLSYTLDINSGLISKNELDISVKEANICQLS